MAKQTLPTVFDLRKGLMEQADTFIHLTESSRSALGDQIMGDTGFFWRFAGPENDGTQGRDITLDTYEKVRVWLEDHWPG